MHRSRLSDILIDCSEDAMEASVQFWSRALGMTVHQPDDPASPYVALTGGTRSGCENLSLAITSLHGVRYRHGNTGCLTF